MALSIDDKDRILAAVEQWRWQLELSGVPIAARLLLETRALTIMYWPELPNLVTRRELSPI